MRYPGVAQRVSPGDIPVQKKKKRREEPARQPGQVSCPVEGKRGIEKVVSNYDDYGDT
tara:strand:- start:65681 stop:65854 length:174 start_codon:yes stop_codon:yes gene_type:complete